MQPHYGQHTVVRPQVVNIPEPPHGAVLTKCPYCGAQCWLTSVEQNVARVLSVIGPLTFTSACTRCAMARHANQEKMDRERWERENAEAAELAASGGN